MKKSLTLASILFVALTHAVDTPRWAGSNNNNMISSEKNMPVDIAPGTKQTDSEEIDITTTKNCAWVAKLGSLVYSTPAVAGGRVFIGTNNDSPRNPKYTGDRSALYAFDENTGSFLWELNFPKLGAGKVSDWEFLGICSTPTIVADKGYLIGNRCEIICFDVNGQTNDNQGISDEGVNLAGKNREGAPNPPITIEKTDGDILWRYDMREELGIFPHNIASSSPLIIGNTLVATTSNGVDWSHTNIPAPQAPSLIMLNKDTGTLLGEGGHDVSKRCLHCSWSSPTSAEVDKTPMILFGGGDGWAYGLSSETQKDAEGYDIMKEFWRFDCNPPEHRISKDGKPFKYTDYDGPSECIGTPVYHDGLVYVSVGQDPEHGEGVGMLSCIDPKQRGDLSGKAKWTFTEIGRTMCTPSIKDGLLYIADHTGRVFCLDAKTGQKYWMFDTKGHIWSSTLLVDGKLYVANEEGQLYILQEGKELKIINEIEFPGPIYAGPVAANGKLYITTTTHIYAFENQIKPKTPLAPIALPNSGKNLTLTPLIYGPLNWRQWAD